MMRAILLVGAFAVCAGVVDAAQPTAYLPVEKLRTAKIEVYDLESSERIVPPEESFNGRPIRCHRSLEKEEINELFSLMSAAEARENAERMEAKASGQVTGGVVACVTEEYGLRFSLPEIEHDSFVTLKCQRIYPVARDGKVLVLFNEAETELLRKFLRKALPCS